MTNKVEVNNLVKYYGDKEAVKKINFTIKENEIIGLLGPNGSGKTTTIGMILGLLKPTSGEILIDGEKIEKKKNRDFKKNKFYFSIYRASKKTYCKTKFNCLC